MSIQRIRVEPRLKQVMLDAASDPSSIQTVPKNMAMAAIEKFSEYYHARNRPLVEDHYYDEMEKILKKRFPRHEFWQQSGHVAVKNKRAEVDLPTPMPGLNQLRTSSAGIKKFFQKPGSYVAMEKLDGISLQIIYVNGLPTEAYTRGNSSKGQDVSHILKNLKIPRRIPVRGRFGIRAEAIIQPGKFDAKHNSHKTKDGKFKAARNMVGGVINKLPSSKNYDEYKRFARDIDVVVFEILEGSGSKSVPSKQLAQLKKLKFTVVWHKKVGVSVVDELSALYTDRIKKTKYEIDGIVIAKEVTYTRTPSLPKHAFKFKENSEGAMQTVKVRSVEWEVSRNKTIIPTVTIDPIRLGGVQVSNFLGHSLFFILNGFKKSDAKKGLPKREIGPGAVIKVVRSGNVIPYIVEVIKSAPKGASLPDVDYTVNGVHAVYTGRGTASDDMSKIKRLTHFFSKLGLDGFKQSTMKKLYDAGYRTPLAVSKIVASDLTKLDSFGTKTAQSFPREIKRVLNRPDFATFVAASGYLPKFGQDRVQMIVDEFPNILRWKKMKRAVIINRVQSVRGFKELAYEFADNLPKVFRLADKLGVRLTVPKKQKPTGTKYSGLNVTFTGVRDKDLEAEIAAGGGKVQSMKSDTNLLVVKDDSYTSSKVDKAIANGIRVMPIDKFRRVQNF